MSLFVKIDKDGLVYDNSDQPLEDLDQIHSFLSSLKIDTNHTYRGKLAGQDAIVEPYSFAIVAQRVNSIVDSKLNVDCQNDYVVDLDLNKIFLDYADRFIIYSTQGIPVILSDEAQDQLFNMADAFDDDSITLENHQYPTPLWIGSNPDLSNSDLWSERYENQSTGWDMGAPSPTLVWAVEKLKLPRMRVAVLGCGAGHDAQFLASKGHMVTGFDFSQEAIDKAQTLYPSQQNLKWVNKDVFLMSEEYRGQFDLVIEHTCFCAIDPQRRSELVKVWRDILSPEGQVLGVFFVMPKNYGPPFGGTEEEIQSLMQKDFRNNLWVRSKVSHPARLGRELIVLARVKNR